MDCFVNCGGGQFGLFWGNVCGTADRQKSAVATLLDPRNEAEIPIHAGLVHNGIRRHSRRAIDSECFCASRYRGLHRHSTVDNGDCVGHSADDSRHQVVPRPGPQARSRVPRRRKNLASGSHTHALFWNRVVYGSNIPWPRILRACHRTGSMAGDIWRRVLPHLSRCRIQIRQLRPAQKDLRIGRVVEIVVLLTPKVFNSFFYFEILKFASAQKSARSDLALFL